MDEAEHYRAGQTLYVSTRELGLLCRCRVVCLGAPATLDPAWTGQKAPGMNIPPASSTRRIPGFFAHRWNMHVCSRLFGTRQKHAHLLRHANAIAGIGCMLESNHSGEVYIAVVVNGGSAFRSGIEEVCVEVLKCLCKRVRVCVEVCESGALFSCGVCARMQVCCGCLMVSPAAGGRDSEGRRPQYCAGHRRG